MRLKNLNARNVDKIKMPQSPWEPHAKSCQNKQTEDVSLSGIFKIQYEYGYVFAMSVT